LFRWASLAAATCLLVAIGITWQAMHAVRDGRLAAAARANHRKAGLGGIAELAHRVAAKTDAMMGAAADAQRWAYLDQDARSILATPAARLPFDVVSSLLSVPRQDRARGPSPRAATRLGNGAFQEPSGVRHALNSVTDMHNPTGRCYRGQEERQYYQRQHRIFLPERGKQTKRKRDMANRLTHLAA
jgi:hypothetical protein